MVKGEVHMIFRDAQTGEVTKEHTQKNTITEDMLAWMARSDSNIDSRTTTFGQCIWLGGSPKETDRWSTVLFDWYPDSSQPISGVQPISFKSGNVGTGDTFAYYYEYQQRFGLPSSDRDIYAVGIGRKEDYGWRSNSTWTYNRPLYMGAYIGLSSPCTQTTTETLDIFYRIIWDNPDPVASGMTGHRIRSIAQRHMNFDSGFGVSNNYKYYPSHNAFFYQGRKMIPYSNADQFYSPSETGVGTIDSPSYSGGGQTYNWNNRARVLTFSCAIDQLVGRVVGFIGHGDGGNYNNRCLFLAPLLNETESPVQNIFPHKAGNTGPFYSSAGLAVGDATVEVNGDGWTNPDFAKHLNIEITNSGVVGVAQYQFHLRNITGFVNNSWEETEVAIPILAYSHSFLGQSISEGEYFYRRSGCMAYKWGDHPSIILMFRKNWLGKLDIVTQERKLFDANSTVALPVTEIAQICTVPTRANIGSLVAGDVWIACANTGLYRLYADDSTVEVFDATHPDLSGIVSGGCYGVTYTPGRIWAMFDNALAYTEDNGASWSIHDSGSTVAYTAPDAGAHPERVWSLHGDPAHADHRLCVAYNRFNIPNALGDPTVYGYRADIYLYWWDSVTGHGNGGVYARRGTESYDYQRERLECFKQIECSPDDGLWGVKFQGTSTTLTTRRDAIYAFNGTSPVASMVVIDDDGRLAGEVSWAKSINGDDAFHSHWSGWDYSRYTLLDQSGTVWTSGNMNDGDGSETLGTNNNYLMRTIHGSVKCFIPSSGIHVYNTLRYYPSSTSSNQYNMWGFRPAWIDFNNYDGGNGRNIGGKVSYGWNGSSWEANHAGSKTTHAGHEALVDGLTVAFDDSLATQTFNDTDYYSVGIVDGVLVDAAVEFSHEYNIYYKPVIFNQSDIEGGGTLPATISDEGYRGYASADRYSIIDSGGGVVYQNGRLEGTSGNSNSFFYARSASVLHDHIDFRYRLQPASGSIDHYCGLCPAGDTGFAPSASNINWGIRVYGNSDYTADIISNGSVVKTLCLASGVEAISDPGESLWNYTNSIYLYVFFRRAKGSTDLEVYWRENLVHTFTGVGGDLRPAVYSGRYGYTRWETMNTSYDDYLIAFGEPGNSTGIYEPDYYRIDDTNSGRPKSHEVKIDGVPVTTLYRGDHDVVLNAGEISIVGGRIRYSAADVGKVLTIDRYNVLLHE